MTRPAPWKLALCLAVLLPLAACARGLKKEPEFQRLESKVQELDQNFTTQLGRLENELSKVRAEVRQLRGAEAVADVSSALAAQTPRTEAEVEAQYRQGRALYVQGDYEAAAEAFRRLAAQNSTHKLAPNALYWLAECYYSRKKFREALEEFERVVRVYPRSAKAPDALLKEAYSLHMLNQGKEAMTQLQRLFKAYPRSRAARMVREGKTIFRP